MGNKKMKRAGERIMENKPDPTVTFRPEIGSVWIQQLKKADESGVGFGEWQLGHYGPSTVIDVEADGRVLLSNGMKDIYPGFQTFPAWYPKMFTDEGGVIGMGESVHRVRFIPKT